MRITSGGNVGIGTSSPTTFGGFLTVEQNNASGNAIHLITGTSVIYQAIANNTNSLVYLGTRSNHSLVLTTNDTERMRITSGGDICVGATSNPYSAAGRGSIFLNGASTSLYGWGVGGTGTGYMYHNGSSVFIENSVSGGSFNLFQVGAGAITFNTDGSERMRITSGGNVGIGNTSPLTKLTVNNAVAGAILPYIQGTGLSYNNEGISVAGSNSNNTNIGNGLTLYNNVASVGAYGPVIAWSSMTVGGAYNATYAFITGVYRGAGGDNNWSRGDIIFGTGDAYGATERMRIKDSGNVGIGTTSPEERLHVASPTTENVALLVSTATGSFAQYQLKGGATTPWIIGTQDNYVSNGLVFRNVSDRMIITTAGNVGIGTTSPSAKLHVLNSSVGGSYYGQLVVEQSGEAAIQIKGTSYSSIYFSDAANPYEAGIVYDHSSNNLELRGGGNSADLTIASTGAATFSSSVTATRLNAINNRTAIFRNDFADDPVPELIKNPKYAYPNEVVVETYSYSKDMEFKC
jgi:hypothetical protein